MMLLNIVIHVSSANIVNTVCIHQKMESVPYVELFNNTECSKVQANHPLIALHFYSQFIFISSLFRSIYFHLAFPLLCPFSFARLRVTLWLPENFGLIYCFSVLYVHFLLLGSVFLSGFRRILDFFLLFLCFMSILTGSVPYFPLASGCLWTFLLLFSALCPFSPAQFSVSLQFHVHFGLFSLLFFALCPFSPAQFGISIWLHVHFGLFPLFFSLLYPYGRVQKSPDCEKFGSLQTTMSSEVSRLR